MKTSIVSCPSCAPQKPLPIVTDTIYYTPYVFSIGDNVYFYEATTLKMIRGVISAYNSTTLDYTVYYFSIPTTSVLLKYNQLYIFKCCNC